MGSRKAVIHSNPKILGGIPVFVGTRVPVKNLIGKNQVHLYPQIGASVASSKRPANAVDFLHQEENLWLCKRTWQKQSRH